jgi:hypothetical protein
LTHLLRSGSRDLRRNVSSSGTRGNFNRVSRLVLDDDQRISDSVQPL